MQCPSCNGFRPANNAPCPSCNAPSPLVNGAWNGQNTSFPGNQNQAAWGSDMQNQAGWSGSGIQNQAAWGGSGAFQNDWSGSNAGQMAFPQSQPNFGGSGAFQNDWSGSNAGQMAFPQSQPNFGGSGVQQMAFPQSPDNGSDNSFWSQNMTTRDARSAGKQPSLLPVPFQGGQPGANGQGLAVLPTGFPTLSPGIQQVNSLLPALPDGDQEAPVYVAPMYTKPRPIIPRYRAISGLISVIIICSLLCGGSIYYAQVTGKLTGLEKIFGGYSPPAVITNQQKLPVPSSKIAYTNNQDATNVIDSVGISTSANNGQIPALINQFTVGQTIYLTCGAKVPKDSGTITIKWYTDDHFYRQDQANVPKGKPLVTATFTTVYGLPAEGKVEVYWNNQLAATVLFVVEPIAA